MRGIANIKKKLAICIRITPAYAGNSENQSEEVIDNEDHPRICGE